MFTKNFHVLDILIQGEGYGIGGFSELVVDGKILSELRPLFFYFRKIFPQKPMGEEAKKKLTE